MPDIRIPDELKPADGRFGCGPSKVRPEAVERARRHLAHRCLGTSHRQKPVRDQVARLRRGIGRAVQPARGLRGGARQRWHDGVLGVGRLRADPRPGSVRQLRRVRREVRRVGQGGAVPRRPDRASRPSRAPRRSCAAEAGVDAYCTPHNETSTGVAVPVRRIVADDALMLHDATSGAGGLDVDVSESDVYYFAPQKCFGSDGGLWIALMSPAAIARVTEIKESGRYIPAFLDLGTAVENSRLEQTYNTPGAGHPLPGRRAGRLDARRRRAGLLRPSARRRAPASSTAGPSAATSPPRSWRSRRCGPTWSAPSTSPTSIDATDAGQGAASQRHRRHRAVPQAGPQPAAHRACSRPSTRRTSKR